MKKYRVWYTNEKGNRVFEIVNANKATEAQGYVNQKFPGSKPKAWLIGEVPSSKKEGAE